MLHIGCYTFCYTCAIVARMTDEQVRELEAAQTMRNARAQLAAEAILEGDLEMAHIHAAEYAAQTEKVRNLFNQ